MSIFGFNEAAAVAAFSAVCAWATHVFPRRKSAKAYFRKYNPKWSMYVLNWFRWTWVVETALLTITLFYFAQNTPADSWNIIAGTVLFFAHLFSIRVRNMLFWDTYNPRWTVAFGWPTLLLTTIGFWISMIVHNVQGLWYVPVITFGIYSVHLLATLGWFHGFYRRWLFQEFPEQAARAAEYIVRVPASWLRGGKSDY